ncbi:MAG: hypothetical protein IJ589_06480 [Lachnospiraceae bacterium]|nr:hypothetical protein [Lachnospiraceae bacterium]
MNKKLKEKLKNRTPLNEEHREAEVQRLQNISQKGMDFAGIMTAKSLGLMPAAPPFSSFCP